MSRGSTATDPDVQEHCTNEHLWRVDVCRTKPVMHTMYVVTTLFKS